MIELVYDVLMVLFLFVGKALIVQPVHEELERPGTFLFQCYSLLLGFTEISGEGGAKEFGVVRQDGFVHNERLLFLANEDGSECRD